MEVLAISRETIKPSSPTPLHLRHYQLSFIDQISPPIYMPLTLFYLGDLNNANVENVERSDRLKKSLAEILTQFYPLAGRIKDGISVDCNDDGVEYFETRINCQLSEVIGKYPDLQVIAKLLPCESYNSTWIPSGPEVLLAIQVNIFECGGMVISVCMSHKIADASSLATFINSWANTACGAIGPVNPIFGLTRSLFPPLDLSGFPAIDLMIKEKIVTKRFVFDTSNMVSLKAKVANGSSVEHPTRVEAVSALIWKVFKTMARVKGGTVKAHAAMHAVNLRGRMGPTLLEHSFGNLWWTSTASMKAEDEIKGNDLVVHLRDAIRKINGDYVKQLLVGDGYLNYAKTLSEQISSGEVELLTFSSWCRFPFYEADFGWGKPIWLCAPAIMPVKNAVALMDTRSGDGIEAWVYLLEEDMAIFETDQELLAFVSSVPSA